MHYKLNQYWTSLHTITYYIWVWQYYSIPQLCPYCTYLDFYFVSWCPFYCKPTYPYLLSHPLYLSVTASYCSIEPYVTQIQFLLIQIQFGKMYHFGEPGNYKISVAMRREEKMGLTSRILRYQSQSQTLNWTGFTLLSQIYDEWLENR